MFPSYAMSPLNSSIKSQGRNPSLVMEVSRGPAEDVDIDLKEVYFLIMHFLSLGPCQRTYVQFWNELHEHQLLPRRYHAWYSRNGDPCGDDNDNGISLPLNYSNLVERYSHIPKNHLVNLLKQLLVCSSPPVSGTIGGNYSNAADVPTLLGSGPFSLLLSDKDKNVSTQSSLPQYLRWPHMHANQIQGLNLREIGGGFSRHHRAPSTRAACYTIAKPSTLVEKMQVIKKLRGHQNAVYCAIFDRTGRYVITGSDDRLVKIWSMETAFCLASCRGHEGDITDLAVSTNNTLVASASNDFIIRIWRLPDGLPISVLRGHTAAVTAIAFSPRPGSVYQLLSSSDDGTCRIWDARYSQSVPRVYTPKPPEVVPGKSSNPAPNNTPPSNQILCCAFNANGTVFVTGSADTYARVWNACKPISEDSELPNHEMDLLSGHENDVNYVQFSGCAVSSKFSVCDYSKEDNIPKFKNSWFGHDNIVTCSRDGSAIIWIPRSRRSHGKVGRWTRAYHLKVPPPPIPPQPSRGGPRQRFQLTPRGVNMIVWSLDNRFVLAAIMDCRICVWNASDGSLVHCLMGHSESTFVLDVHPFNPRIAMSAGYDGKTIIWDIWEGIPVRVYETGRFRLVDGKFSPDGTSVVLSDEVGQIFIIATGQGESQKDAKYDQFFLGDYRPLIQDAQGNVLDQETQLAPYRRNMQDLLCDSCMIPYPDPYQNIFQKRRLGALNIEWRPSSLKFAVGPSNNVNAADNHILAIADLDRWVEPVPEFLDAMDWEPEIEIQTDDADSEYNVTEEDSSDGGLESLGGSSSVDTEGSAEESEADHSHHRSNKEALRRSMRRKPKSEMELTTSSGRKVKRRNLDANEEAMPKKRKKQRRHGKLTSKKKSLKSKPHRPQRRAARNALSFLSQIGEASTEEEEDESETGSSDDDSALPDSNTQSNESDRSFLNSKSKQARGKEICSNEPLDASKSVRAIDSQTETGHRRRLVFKLPLRDPKRHISLEKTPTECIQGSFDASSSKDGNANKILSGFWEAGPSSGDKVNTQDNTGMSSKDIEYCENMINPSGFSSECHDRKIKWGEVKMRSSKRIRFGDGPMVDKSPSPTAVIEDQNTIRILENGCLKADDVQRRPPSTTSGANEFDHSRINSVSNHLANGVPDQLGEGSSGFVCKSLTDHPPMHSAASNERECIQGASDDVKNEVGYTNKAHQDLPNVIISQNSGEIDHQDMGADIVEYRSVDGHDMDHSNKVDTLGQPFFKKLRFTSKRPGNEASSSSYKVRPTESQNSSACTMLPNERTPMENILSVVHEEKGSYGSSDHGNHPESSNFLLRRQISQTKTANTKPNTGQIGSRFGLHDTEGSVSDYDDNGHQQAEFPNSSEHQFVRTRSTSSREVPDESTSTTNNFKSQDIHVRSSRNILKLSLNGHDQSHNDDRKSTSRSTVGLRSTRNRRETYNSPEFRPLDKRKSQCPPRKLSWLMLLEHEECYRYIPQLGDEVAYLRQGHEEYLTATHSNNVGPWKLAKNLRAVEFCKVIGMEYATLPGSGESCCKLTLEFIDPVSCELGKVFKFTLPELAEFPDFLVERMRYESSLERNWTNRDKCRVWWRNEDGEGGSWWEGRILYAKAKSTEFPDSPWEKYVIQYKSDSSGQHQHSPWELHDADTHWEHPHIDDYSIKKLLSSISKIEQTSSNTKDTYGLQKLKQVSEKSEFLNRFPVPMSIEAVKQRLENKYYRNLDAVHHDIRVMLSNAETYFAKSAEYSSKIKKLSELVRREIFL